MIPGAPVEARWIHRAHRRELPAQILGRIAGAAFPGSRVVDILPLEDGIRNSNFKVRLDAMQKPIVLRIYEHDPSLCRKELDLYKMVRAAVPVPEVLYADPLGFEDLPPFTLLRYVDGITFRELQRGGDLDAIAQAAYSAGETLAAIGQLTFSKPGWLAAGPTVTAPLLEGDNPIPRFVDACLGAARLQERVPAELRGRTHDAVWSRAAEFTELDRETRLVHGDFNKRNVLVRPIEGRWSVAAILDWEFAVSGSPLLDLGNFLTYERAERPQAEPHFSTGYLHGGGALPKDWRRLARVLRLIGLCDGLMRDQLPSAVEGELVELVRATVEDRDPRFE